MRLPVIDPSKTSFLICSYTKSNKDAARGEPVEYICRKVERLWCAFGSLYVFYFQKHGRREVVSEAAYHGNAHPDKR
jgi:hypothetical protein